MPVAERQRETGNRDAGSSASGARITGRIGAAAPTRKGADAGRVSLRGPMIADAGTEGQVGHHDAWTRPRSRPATAVVNGPEGEPAGLGRRGLAPGRGGRTAAAAADLRGIAGGGPEEGPQSAEVDAPLPQQRAGGVRRVTELNAGRKTAGVDGRGRAAARSRRPRWPHWLQHRAEPWSPRPVKRVYVPKSNGRRRPLGIPVIADRCLQALTVERAGTRVGGPVRAEVLRVPAGPGLPRRDRGHPHDGEPHRREASVGAGRRPGGGVGCVVILLPF